MNSDRRPRNLIPVALLALALLQGGLYVAANDPAAGALNSDRLWTFDHPFNIYWASMGRKFVEADAAVFGYDPAFMAGYPLTFLENSCLFIQLIFAAAPWAEPNTLYKLVLMLIVVLVPLLVYGAARNFRLDPGQALLASLLAVAYARTGLWSLLFYGGGVTQSLMLVLFVYALSVFHRWLGRGGLRLWALAAAMLVVLTLVHRGAVFVFPALALAAAAASGLRLLRRNRPLHITAMGAVLFAVNLVWIVPMLRFMDYKVPLPFDLLQNLDPLKPFKDVLTPTQGFERLIYSGFYGTMLIHLTLVAGAAWAMARDGLGDFRTRFLLGAAAWLFFLGYYGSFFSATAISEPYRHTAALFLLLTVPAALGLSRGIEAVRRRLGPGAPGRVAAAAGIGVLAVFMFLPSYGGFAEKHPPRTRGNEEYRQLEAWLAENTHAGVRVMIEDAQYNYRLPPAANPYEDSYVLGFAPRATGRSFLGGPTTFYTIRYSYATFKGGLLLGRYDETGAFGGRPVMEYDPPGFQRTLDRYNVGWIAAHSAAAYPFLDMNAGVLGLTKVAAPGGYHVYKTAHGSGYLIEGRGRVWTGPNRIVVDNAAPGAGGFLTLKLHHARGMKSRPRLSIEPFVEDPELMEPDVAFIRVKNPPRRFVIWME